MALQLNTNDYENFQEKSVLQWSFDYLTTDYMNTGLSEHILADRLKCIVYESVPLLYCVISGGCDRLQLLLVGKSKRSRPMIGVQKLPVVYDYQQKAWMTGNIFP
ncbi:hypothetical protein T03_12982 [Trichinella britovi]|uniref:DDE-1 domain-containing protein n=1 Tax=Trichinella britovi TaxID=45882 RepID=A0A0V1C7J5_TRIBR|nr:hypothetical protein T03_12982 [Trichinella britovi]